MKRLLLLLVLLVTVFQGFSQTKGISYQAVILNPNPQELPGVNAENNILANSAVSIQFTIVNASGTEEYQDEHSTRTDKYGMINLLIGTGSATSSNDFSDIFWDGTTKKLKVGIDFNSGSNFSPLSEQNLTYMPQPPTEEVSEGIASNSVAIEAEQTRAQQAEQSNAGGISALQAEQAIQNTAIALNTTKVGITPAQASTISNTTGINTGDQDISGIAINATAITTEATTARAAEMANANDISTIEAEQTTQNTAIASNTAKVSYPGDQDISGIAINSNTISTIEAEQTIQNTAIASNTAKVSYPGDQDISGIATNATAIASNTTGIAQEKLDRAADVTAEEARAIAAEEVLTAAIADEATTARAREVANANAITAEELARIAGDDSNATAIVSNTTDISALEAEQTTQNTAIASNTAKVSYPGDQDISGIAINSSTISTIKAEQITQNTAIDLKQDNVIATAPGQIQVWDGTKWIVSTDKIGIGNSAGSSSQGVSAVAVGSFSGQIFQGSDAVAVGFLAGNESQGVSAVAVGSFSGQSDQGLSAIAIGNQAGQRDQGVNAIAIGNQAGTNYQLANSIILNASGNVLNAASQGFFVAPVRTVTTSGTNYTLSYNSATKEIFLNDDAQISGTNTGDQDGSETKVTAGTNVTITGSGTTASPYVVNATSSAGPLAIGQTHQGGIIFYLDPSNLHGLIAAPLSQETTNLWFATDTDTRAYGSGLFEGKFNTRMINTLLVPPVTNAASICLSYTGGGFNNWYLPSIYELELMYLNIGMGNALGLGNIGQFTPTSYWSSTEYNVNSAWEQYFGPVYSQGLGRKGIVQSVRAIRAF